MSRYHKRRDWPALRRVALDRADYRCQMIEDGERCISRSALEVDHIRPVATGGTHTPDNLQVLCRRHHLEKTRRENGEVDGTQEWRELVNEI